MRGCPRHADKTGVDDILMDGHTIADLMQLVNRPAASRTASRSRRRRPHRNPPVREPIRPGRRHKVFHRWLGEDYDTDALDASWPPSRSKSSTTAPTRSGCWSSPGPADAKTETVVALDGAGAIVTSAITCEGALLSATPKHDRAKDATGGLLRKMGDRGVLVIKDVTSMLSMDTQPRGQVLAALREVYDGRWYRNVGADGGKHPRMEGPASPSSAPSPPPGTPTTRHRHHGRPLRAGPNRFLHSTAGGRAAKRSATPATRRRCVPSWPQRSAA